MTSINQQNPLARFMRQPKIYIELPSKGQYWANGSIDIPDNGKIPVFSMTARDEILFSTPDALLNGQAVVDVIQSCVPCIKNAWCMPSIDVEMIIIAINIATYGDKKTMKYNIPEINEEAEYEVNLHTLIDHYSSIQWVDQIPLSDEMIAFVQPLTYKQMNAVSQKSFEMNKLLQVAEQADLTDIQKSDIVNKSFRELTTLSSDMLVNCIYKIKIGAEDVTALPYIKEFIENADKSVTDLIMKHLNDLKVNNELKPLVLSTTEEQQRDGAPATFEVPLNFDQSTFFG